MWTSGDTGTDQNLREYLPACYDSAAAAAAAEEAAVAVQRAGELDQAWRSATPD